MTASSLTKEFAGRVRLPLEGVEDGLVHSVSLDSDLILEFVWLAEVPALCLAIPVGRMVDVPGQEGFAGLPACGPAADAPGRPHYAASIRQDTLYLCQTLMDDASAAPSVQTALDGLAQIARQARGALLQASHAMT